MDVIVPGYTTPFEKCYLTASILPSLLNVNDTIHTMKENIPQKDSVCKITIVLHCICLATLHKNVTEVTEPSEIGSETVVIKTQRAKITSAVKVKKATVGCRRP